MIVGNSVVSLRVKFHRLVSAGIGTVLASAICMPAMAQVVPGAADAGRVQSPIMPPIPGTTRAKTELGGVRAPADVAVPAGAESVDLTLNSVRIEGATAFSADRLDDLYEPLLGKRVSLAQVYILAADITRLYRDAGFMLSYAFVPEQSIESGNVTIAVAEVYLDQVVVDGDDPNQRITQQYIKRLTSERPLTNRTLESTLLRLNDLPGRTYRAVLDRNPQSGPNAMMLTLVPTQKAAQATVGFDNFSSRYLGPNEINAYYANSLLPLQQTSVLGLTSLPMDALNYAALQHSMVVAPDVSFELSGSYTDSKPGYKLAPLQIESKAYYYQLSANYQAIRQRDENLLLKIAGGARRITSDVFSTTRLTRDNVRTVEASASYSRADSWGGYNTINAVITKGIEGLGGSKKGDLDLSRAQADPNFMKVELSLSHLQPITTDWSVLMQTSGQLANKPMFASEEFGVGGQTYGRAYDSSEIVGDEGASAMAELRYHGWRILQPINVEPFVYYDIGFVTNKDSGQSPRDSLSSAGGGLRFATTAGQSGMIGLAFPLTRDVEAPIYGANASSPRLMLQIAHNF